MKMNDEPNKPQTFFQQAQSDLTLEASGRFATQSKPRIVGAEPFVTVPGPIPVWAQGPQPGQEPPLGWSVEDMGDCADHGPAQEPMAEELSTRIDNPIEPLPPKPIYRRF